MSDLKPISITGELFYASDMVQFNQYTEDKQVYVAQIGNISDEDVQKLTSMGIHVGHNETKGHNITCKSKYVHKPVDTEGNEVDPMKIGNGTKCKVVVGGYHWKFGKKSGVGASAKKIIVTELIEYTPMEKETADDIL